MRPVEPPLQPLRVPSQWNVTFNEFRETMSPEYLCEDLFQAKHERADVLVDLGWYPDGDPSGRYKLVAHRGDFHGEELLHEEAATSEDAVQRLEAALMRFTALAPPRAERATK